MTSLRNTHEANKRILRDLQNEKKLVVLEDALEMQLIQSLLMNEELDLILNQRYEEPEDEYTYEELLALGDQIGKVSKGLSEEKIAQLASETLKTSANCSICLVDMNKGTEVTVLNPCTHVYHFSCIKTWLKDNKTCPLCLQELVI